MPIIILVLYNCIEQVMVGLSDGQMIGRKRESEGRAPLIKISIE